MVSDARAGLKTAVGSVLLGATWQRCRVRSTHDALDAVPRGDAETVVAAICTVFAQPDAEHVADQYQVTETVLVRSHPKAATMTSQARDDGLATTTP